MEQDNLPATVTATDAPLSQISNAEQYIAFAHKALAKAMLNYDGAILRALTVLDEAMDAQVSVRVTKDGQTTHELLPDTKMRLEAAREAISLCKWAAGQDKDIRQKIDNAYTQVNIHGDVATIEGVSPDVFRRARSGDTKELASEE